MNEIRWHVILFRFRDGSWFAELYARGGDLGEDLPKKVRYTISPMQAELLHDHINHLVASVTWTTIVSNAVVFRWGPHPPRLQEVFNDFFTK